MFVFKGIADNLRNLAGLLLLCCRAKYSGLCSVKKKLILC